MKKSFLFLTAALCTANAWAQNWRFDEPEPRVTKNIVADGQSEYLISLNDEGTEYFYGQGADWGTRATAKEDVSEALRVRFTPTSQIVMDSDGVETEVACVRLENWASDRNYITWRAADCDGGKSVWVDGTGRDGDGKWQLNLLGDGKFELTNLNAPGGKFGLAKGRMEWDDALEDYTEATPHGDVYTDFDNRLYFVGCAITDSVNVYDYDADPDDDGNYPVKERVVRYLWGEENLTTWQAYEGSLYTLQLQIMNWYYEEYEENYPDYYGDSAIETAIGEVSKAYNKAGVTYAELNEAWEKLQDAIAWYSIEQLADMLAGATEDEPIDATEIIVNPDFSDGTNGWDFQLTGGTNHVQPDTYQNGEIRISTFAESWIYGGGLLDDGGSLTQQIGLPVGRYTLEADIIACSQSSQENSHGTYLFADVDGKVSEVEARTANNAPEHYIVVFDVEKAGNVTIGLKLVQPTVNWVAIDNFKLTYYGVPTKPWAQVQLGRICNEYAERYDLEDIYAQPQYKQEYAEALEAAQDAFENGGLTDEVYEELGDSVRSKANKLQGSIDDYNVFAQRIEILAARVDEMRESTPACADELAEYYDVLTAAYEAGAWNREQIDGILDSIGEIIGRHTGGNLLPGDDVSYLLNNATFDTDFSGWSTVSGGGWSTPWWGPDHNDDQMNLTGTMAEDENVEGGFLPSGNAECWHGKFDMYQKIYNMPAGLFNVTCQAFARQDDDTSDQAYIYAILPDGTEVSQPVMGLWDDPSDERLFENNSWFSDAEQNGKYVPNGMGGANFHFEAGYYKNTFSIFVSEPGIIQIGIKTNSTHLWVIFDNFKITYEGTGANAWIPTIEEEIAKVSSNLKALDVTEGTRIDIEKVLARAENFCKRVNAATEEMCVEMLNELKAQYNVMAKNIELQEKVKSCEYSILSIEEKALEASADVQKRYEACYDAVCDGGYYGMNNAEMENLIAEINEVVTLVKIPAGWENASIDNPYDFSALIPNPRFHAADNYEEYYGEDYLWVDEETGEKWYNEPNASNNFIFDYWLGRQFNTGGGEPANCGEVWNAGEFDAYLELNGLPEGTYELSCDGFYRHGNGILTSAAILAGEQEAYSNAYLYATSSAGSYSTTLNNIASPQVTDDEFYEMGLDGTRITYNGYVYPDQLRTADCFFKAGLYEKNTVRCKVGADGVLRIGVKKDGTVVADWVVVDNFQLTYYGTEGDTVVVEPTGDYYMSMETQEIRKGETNLIPVYLNNKFEDAISFGCEILLPANMTVVKDKMGDYNFTLGERCDNTFSITSNDIGDKIRVVIFSVRNHTVDGTSGPLFYIPVEVSDYVADNSRLRVKLSNITVTKSTATGMNEFRCPDVSTIFTVAPSFTVGDVNGDGLFTPIDISMTVDYVLGNRPAGAIAKAADANGDGIYSPIDISMVVSYVLAGTNKVKAVKGQNSAVYAETMYFDGTADGQWQRLGLTNAERYTAAQFDVFVPEGVKVVGARMSGEASNQNVLFKELGNGMVRVLAYSATNANIAANSFMEILLESKDGKTADVTIGNVLLVSKAGNEFKEVCAQGLSFAADATAIGSIFADAENAVYYNLSGQRVARPAKGLYIVDGKKAIIK